MADTHTVRESGSAKRSRSGWLGKGLTLAAVVAGLAVPVWQSRARADQPAATQQPVDEAEAADEREPTTTIKAREMTYDLEKRISTYKGDVHILHNDVELFADSMIVTHAKNNQPTKIEAVGDVRIQRGDKLANSQRAEYFVARQVIVLTGNPRMQQGSSTLVGAERLMFHQTDGRFQTAGGRVHLSVSHETETDGTSGTHAGENEPIAPGSTPQAP